ncbi:SIR2-like domain-containing protein [Polaromonas sp. YR568]|uniref:anti-phage defense-associated sirtuin Dsr1 n=1 Tax=Polaromonas sp. YR568 TaxID=1855301 RepID=UPI0008EEDCCF|nr:anti-phage defense-associated sirtuin Dsr1 [Polaromonas sp. YR568]SFV04148.1 SIR2-like domain-containing protein [Polaromonas sp. YR568]
MKFLRDGPDIPERLLQLHEDGRVVFFCGAGISYPARLPGFGGLVDMLYAELSVIPNAVQLAAIKAGQFDTAIGLLEAGVMGGRETVRRAMALVLKPDFSAPNATATHEALLTLSQNRTGRTRLITTNFDRLFEHLIKSQSLSLQTYQAPLLPVPKARWDGLVYLHGLLSAAPKPAELDCLVISSGDFGLAYLTERWAARFVSELFRGYTVCFIGYSINDPVLRYMMDALAADRLLGESPPEMFAFGSYKNGKEAARANEWNAKNVTPILYRERKGHDHSYLHSTLRAWAQTYRDGVRGKERIVVECAIGRPLAATKQDDFIGRMLWALSDPHGLPAKRFAELDPVPSLDWLEPLSQDLYRHEDLGRFGVPALVTADKKLEFSFTRRPAPYTKAPWMVLSDSGNRGSEWDAPMHHLACWLVRHLDDPKLLLWLIKRGGRLHHQLTWLIERRLNELAKLERSSDAKELARIRNASPKAIPRAAMRTLWRLLLNGRVRAGTHSFDLYRWREQFKRDGLTASVRFALKDALAPCVVLREPFHWSDETVANDAAHEVKNIVDWELELASDHVHSALSDIREDRAWLDALPHLLLDFNVLLHDALDLMQELGDADGKRDHSYSHQPSISKHPQNRNFHDWTALIELARDAWVATASRAPEQARAVAEAWASGPYPVFRRLSFFTGTHVDVIPPTMTLRFLFNDESWWLWSVETQREALRLLVALAPVLDRESLDKLEAAILIGPPREMFRSDIDADHWAQLVNREIWLRLKKLTLAGAVLGELARSRLGTLSEANPIWDLEGDEREEFPFWMDSGWVGNRDPWRTFTAVPRSRRGVLAYLLAHPELGPDEQDDWRQRCSESFQATAYALYQLVIRKGIWPVERWRDALQAWSEDKLRTPSWHFMAPLLVSAPESLLQATAHGMSWWLQSIGKTFEGHLDHFVILITRVLRLEFDVDDKIDEPVFHAINHPVGHVTNGLLDWWYRDELEDGQQLPQELKTIFTYLCDTTNVTFVNGRVLLATHAITLFRVDPDWAARYLLPLFDWRQSATEARSAWEGYLWSPRLYRPMMQLLKPAFLDTASHYGQLGKHGSQYASLLALAALDPGDTFKTTELASAVRSLSAEGLRDLAEALVKAVESTGKQREEYWRNRVSPFWKKVWPKTHDRAQGIDGSSLARLCIAAGNEFPAAVMQLENWLRAIEHPDYVIHRLHESGLCTLFPESALQFLHIILSEQSAWLPSQLRQCLNEILLALPNLRQDRRVMRVDELARRAGL